MLEIIIDEQTTIHDIFIPKTYRSFSTSLIISSLGNQQSNNQTNAAHQPTLHFKVIDRAIDAWEHYKAKVEIEIEIDDQ